MRPQLIEFLGAGALFTLLLAWFACPSNILKSLTRVQQKISYLLSPGLATGLAFVTFFRRLVPSLSCPASNALAWIPIAISALSAVFVQSSAFGFVFWLLWSLVSQFQSTS
ncbi:MAG: hypothetical protein ABI972_27320 [Acidobacteriota bacterium]